ncbi:ABC transporter permease [Streptococcus mutans]|uniref:ABC transporter permease n=1 Tax=Streptococcus mutans TaxID=1309 RepID=UPI0038B7829A
MIHYIKFELKNTLGYSIAMIVGGLLPLILAIGNYHSTSNTAANQSLSISLFSTLLPMIPLGLVILPFTIAFGRDTESGVVTRLNLFGYSTVKQLIAKFVSVVILVTAVTVIYLVVLLNTMSLPKPSTLTVINIFAGVLLLTAALYLVAFTIAQVFKGFNMIQGVAMIVYFGIALLTGTMGDFQLTGWIEKVAELIPFKVFRDNLNAHWTSTSFSQGKELSHLLIFLVFTAFLFAIANYFRIRSRH